MLLIGPMRHSSPLHAVSWVGTQDEFAGRILWFYLWARFSAVEVLASTEPPAVQLAPAASSAPSAAVTPVVGCVAACAPAATPGRTTEGRTLGSIWAESTRSEILRAALLVLGPLTIALVAVGASRMRPTLCEVYVVGLLPHQPFPVIEQFLARSFDKHVIAIRFLNEAAKERFFGKFVRRLQEDDSSWRVTRFIRRSFRRRSFSTLTTLDVTHANVKGVVSEEADDERQHYWSLVRYGIGLMLERHGANRQSAIGFILMRRWNSGMYGEFLSEYSRHVNWEAQALARLISQVEATERLGSSMSRNWRPSCHSMEDCIARERQAI